MKQRRNRSSDMCKIFIIIIILLAIVHSCGGSMNISKRAQKYLTKEYGGDFSILDVECISSGNGPIPEFIPKYHWQLTAVSDRFPNHTFKVYYRKDDHKKWYWSDNYHSVLFYNEVFTRTVDCAKQFFQVDSMVQILWSSSP